MFVLGIFQILHRRDCSFQFSYFATKWQTISQLKPEASAVRKLWKTEGHHSDCCGKSVNLKVFLPRWTITAVSTSFFGNGSHQCSDLQDKNDSWVVISSFWHLQNGIHQAACHVSDSLTRWQCPQGSKLKLNSGPKGPNWTGCVKRAWKSIYQLLEGMATCSFPPVRPQQLKAEAFQESAALPVKAVPSSVLTLLGTAT